MLSSFIRIAIVAFAGLAATSSAQAQQWVLVDGAARDVGIGVDGTVWVVGTTMQGDGGYGIYRRTDTGWTQVEGAAERIAVDPQGMPWIVDKDRRLLRYDGQQWILLAERAQDVAIGSGGAAWIVTDTGAIKSSKDNGATWRAVPGSAVSIAVQGDGMPWVVNSAHEIYRLDGVFKQVPGLAMDIGAGPTGSSYPPWVIGTDGKPYRWEGGNWYQATGSASRIAVGPAGWVWVVNSANQIYRTRVGRSLVPGSFSWLDESSLDDTTSHGDAPASWLTSATANWMRSLPDSTPLNRISIPGTHDTGAQCCGVAVRTQTWSVAEQLQAGIRFLDVRVRATGTSWSIHHGDYYLDMQFGDIASQVWSFLASHPHETVLMRIKQDKDAMSGASSHSSIWANYVRQYPWLFYTGYDGTPLTLGDVRGRAVVLRQIGEIPSTHGPDWGDLNIQDYYNVMYYAHDSANSDGTSATLPAKRRLIREQITRARSPSSSVPFYINFLSGSGGMTPANCADYTNDTAFDATAHDGQVRSNGVIVMDFPGEKLV